MKKKKKAVKKKAFKKKIIKQEVDTQVPMSINRLFDNAEDWLNDEPWRTW